MLDYQPFFCACRRSLNPYDLFMRNLVLIILLLSGAATSLSAQVTIQGKISNIAPGALKIALVDYWSVDRWRKLTIMQLENNGEFSTPVLLPNKAQCRIRLAGQANISADFLLPGPSDPSDSILIFDLDARAMRGGPIQIGGYPENDLYYSLVSEFFKLEKLKDPKSDTKPKRLQAAILSLNQLCTEMSLQHRGTYTGDIVANLLYQPQIADYDKDPKVADMSEKAFLAAHSLDKIPFGSEQVLSHVAFAQALYHYYDNFDPADADRGKNYIDGIMAKRNGNENVDLYLFKYLMEKMVYNKDEPSLEHLLSWYPPDCTDESPLPDHTKTMVEALQYCTPGKSIPDFQLPDPEGNMVALKDVCAKNNMTLLYFWKTTCAHCKEFKPVLKELYDKYHPQGLEVLAISLDRVEPIWKTYLEQEPVKWVNVHVPSDRLPEISSRFPIPSTPTLITLDSKCQVLSRLILREQLETYIQDMLPKLNGG